MKAIHVNNLRSQLNAISNTMKNQMYGISEELDIANATKTEKGEFDELIEKMIDVVDSANTLIGKETNWLITKENNKDTI